MNLEYIKNMSINMSYDEKKDFFSRTEVKTTILDIFNKDNLVCFFKDFDEDSVLSFMKDDVIKIINSSSKLDKTYIKGILTSSNKSLEKLFENRRFCKLITDNFEDSKDYFEGLDDKSFDNYLNYLQEFAEDKVNILVFNTNEENQMNFLKNSNYPNRFFSENLFNLNDNAISYFLNNSVNNNFIDKFNTKSLINRNIKFPISILNNDVFINNIVNTYDIFLYRCCMNDLEKSNNVEVLEKTRKQYVDNVIKDIDYEYKMFSLYKDVFDYAKENNFDIDFFRIKYFIRDKLNNDTGEFNDMILSFLRVLPYGEEVVITYLQEDTKMILSDMVIDYHFEDVTYDVNNNMQVVLDYNDSVNILNVGDKKIYEQVKNISTLDLDNIISLHYDLGRELQYEKFYDVIRNAKNKSYISLKDEMINNDNYINYLDEELTEKLGIECIKLEGEKFKSLIRCFPINTSEIGNEKLLEFTRDGSSFSYIGDKSIDTFKSPFYFYTLVYSDFNKDNIVHVSPVDSYSGFSNYDIYKNTNEITDRINTILEPNDLVTKGKDYNELVIATNNSESLDNIIFDNPEPKFILCYDEITPNHALTAKKLGLGIMFVNTLKYDRKSSNFSISAQDDVFSIGTTLNIYNREYNARILENKRKDLVQKVVDSRNTFSK